MNMSRLAGCLSFVLALGAMCAFSHAQAPGGDGGGGAAGGANGGGRGMGGGGWGNRDMSQWRAAMNERLKADLGATDEEFKALQPKIEKVQQLQRDLMSGRFRGFGGRGMGGGQRDGQPAGQPGAQPGGQPAGQPGAAPGGDAANAAPVSPVVTATRELNTLLENKDAKPDEIKQKLEAVRAAKAKAREELAKAQAELKELLSQRQEAVLVNNGTLD